MHTKRRSRGRPRAFDAEKAVDTAMGLFAQNGYDGVGVAELCRVMEITPTSLYAAYGSKVGLFAEAIEAYVRGPASFVGRALTESTTAGEVVSSLLAAAADAYSQNPERTGCMVLDGAVMTNDPDAALVIAKKTKATLTLLRARLKQLGANDPVMAADYLMIVMRGLSSAARTGSSRLQLRAAAEVSAAGLLTKL